MSESPHYDRPALFHQLVESAGAAWTDALKHRFVAEVTNNTLSDESWGRYLVVEWQFIDTAARCLGRAIHVAPSVDHRRRLAAGLHALMTEQVDYFHDAAQRRRLDLDMALPPAADASARKLHDCSLGFAESGDYVLLLGSMYASEVLYLVWCGEVKSEGLDDPLLREWVEMHQGGEFEDHCRRVESELLEQVGSVRSPAFERASNAFTETLRGEVGLHDAVYMWGDSSTDGPE